jgi:meiosis-specific serine/threonine-protein kinase MEK1
MLCKANLPLDGVLLTKIYYYIAFTCVEVKREQREKMTIFDPTPPPQLAQKVRRLSESYYMILTGFQRIGRYIVTSHCLGTGSFATVNLAFDPSKHRQVACKSIKTKRDHEIAQVMREVRILMTLKHVNQ